MIVDKKLVAKSIGETIVVVFLQFVVYYALLYFMQWDTTLIWTAVIMDLVSNTIGILLWLIFKNGFKRGGQ